MKLTELGKIRVPKGALRVEIDDPEDRMLLTSKGTIRGWFATPDAEVPEDFYFQVGAIRLAHETTSREDVEGAMPDYSIVGFNIRYDIGCYLHYITDNRLAVQLVLPDFDPYRLRFTVKEIVMAACVAEASEL
jgi:hypothetical protein